MIRNGMKVAFRVDASLDIGTGHLMRCLTLADALHLQGASIHFICRIHQAHILDFVRQRGYPASGLSDRMAISNRSAEQVELPPHAAWLGCAWQEDAEQTAAVLATVKPDWLIVDHYALDWRWEEHIVPYCKRLFVIDDLADRRHSCDLLLDQNLGRNGNEYDHLLLRRSRVLHGPSYALLRPRFAALRELSLARRHRPNLERILITMGGVDQPNATARVLSALRHTRSLTPSCRITVVMGLNAPWLNEVQQLAAEMPWTTEVLINTDQMAELMAQSDLAIGAAGSTSWERCCLGLPTLTVILAANQVQAAGFLAASGAAVVLHSDRIDSGIHDFLDDVTRVPEQLQKMSECARNITDGRGCARVLDELTLLTSFNG